jgi:ADP-ribosylglycohydrolase
MAQLKRDLAEAAKRPRPPVYSPGKFTEPLGLDEHGNYQPPLTEREKAARDRLRQGAGPESSGPPPASVPTRGTGSGEVSSGAGPSRRQRMVGALLGVHCGDALGATVEFSSWQVIRERYPQGMREIVGGGPFRWPPGHATDDTDLTRAVLLAYLDRAAGRLPDGDVVRAAADRMLAWLDGDWPDRTPGSPPVDIGGATRTGLHRYRASGDPRAAGAGIGQAGNGSLMRCLPTALAIPDRQQRILQSQEISAVTHDDPRCTISCAAYNEIVAALLEGTSPVAAVDEGITAARQLAGTAVVEAIMAGTALDPAVLAASGPSGLPGGEARGYVLDSLALAVAAVLDPRPLPQVLIDIVRIGGDTDTNAAVAGGLLGARDGLGALPRSWVTPLQFADEFATAVDHLGHG